MSDKYTRQIPTEIGYYWYRDEFGERIIEIISDEESYSSPSNGIIQLDSIPLFCRIVGLCYGAEWCGPLKSPQ